MKTPGIGLAGLAFLACANLSAAAAAPDTASQDAQDKQVVSAAIHGPADVNLHDVAILKLPPKTAFLPAAAAATILARMGNTVRPDMLGLVAGGGDWMIVLEYRADGHVPDQAARSLEADKLLARLQTVSPDDRRRHEQGLETLRASRWVEAPHYDSARYQLSWAVEYQTIGANGAVLRTSANRTAVALGRNSRIGLNLVSESGDAQKDAGVLSDFLSRLQFLPGNRYEDFDAGKDKMASYGLDGLIAD
jgi:uncharacterized membrane-anchored protein